MPDPYDLAPDVSAPDLPGRVVLRESGEDVYDAAASELFTLSIDCVRAFGDFHLALSVSPSLEGLFQRLMVDPKFRAMPWDRTHLWLAWERGGETACQRELRELVIEHAGIPDEQTHAICSEGGAEAYQRELRETLEWREPGHDRLDGVMLALDDLVIPGQSSAPDGDLVEESIDGVVRMTRRLINASRLVGVLSLGEPARERLRHADDPPPFGLEPVGGELCWYLDHAACTGASR